MSMVGPLPDKDVATMTDDELSLYEAQKLDVERNTTVAAVSYLYLLALVVLFARRDSPFAQYHARHGTALFCLSLVALALPLWIRITAEVLILLAIIYGFIQASQQRWVRFPGLTDALFRPQDAGAVRAVDTAFVGLTKVVRHVTRPGEDVQSHASAAPPEPSQGGDGNEHPGVPR